MSRKLSIAGQNGLMNRLNCILSEKKTRRKKVAEHLGENATKSKVYLSLDGQCHTDCVRMRQCYHGDGVRWEPYKHGCRNCHM